MRHFAANVVTLVVQPHLAINYAKYAFQKVFSSDVPVRSVHGVQVGDFNSFSEYHMVSAGVEIVDKRFIDDYAFGEGTIIDVGANLGLFSLLMNKRFPDRHTIAFEPSPTTFAALQKNINRNQAKSVECHQLVVSDRVGQVLFETR
jgi:tRNA G46 methylase TrmB